MAPTISLGKRRPGIDTLPFHKVLDPELWTTVRAMTKTNGFPGSLCVSLDRKDIPIVRTKPYWVCEKSDGTRFLLFVCKFKGANLVALVGRRDDDVYAVKVHKVPRELYRGTIIDGEMVRDKATNQETFLVFDVLFVAGRDVRQRPFSERYLDLCAAFLHYEPHARDSIAIKVKAFYPVASIAECTSLARDPVRDRFGWDGLIFTPEQGHVVPGRNYDMYKWKPKEAITVDFCVHEDGTTVLVNDRNNLVPVGRLDQPGQPGSIVECNLMNAHEAVWRVYRVRSDKTYPNDMLTFSKTIANIQEAIALEEFL